VTAFPGSFILILALYLQIIFLRTSAALIALLLRTVV
jgi:hypothetical protein